MIRFDANGNPIEGADHRTKRSYGSAGDQGNPGAEEAVLHAEFSETIIDSNINNSTHLPMEQINGFEVARRAVVSECAKKNYPVVGAVLGGIGYGLEAFFSTATPSDPQGRRYGS